MRRTHLHPSALVRGRTAPRVLSLVAFLGTLATAGGCSGTPAPAAPPAPVASDPAARTGAVTTTASGGAVDSTLRARPAPASAATYAFAPPAALPGALRAAERAVADVARGRSTGGRTGATSPTAAAEASSVAAAESLVPILDLLAAIDAGPAADSATPVADAASRGMQRAQQASFAARSARTVQRGLAWTSVALGLGGAIAAIAGADASTTSAIALAATVTSSITAVMALNRPSGISQAASTAGAPATPAPGARGDSTVARTKGDSAVQALAGEALATRLALDLRVGAQGFGALRDEAVAVTRARGAATTSYASLAPRAAAALDVEVPRLLGLARAGAASPNVPETRRPALADAAARLEAARSAWRRDRALHERAERAALASLASR